MENALIMTALLLGAALAGGYFGAACARGRQSEDYGRRIAELEDRLDALADHCMDEIKKLKDRAGGHEDKIEGAWEWLGDIDSKQEEIEHLIGDTPTGGLLGRVGALEDQRKVNEAEHQALRNALLGGKKEAQ